MTDARPRLLDLFCGAGGAAMGYHRAGFDILGVDIHPQPNYPFPFMQADALSVLDNWWIQQPVGAFQAIHASPPCQAHSTIGKQRRTQLPDLRHPDLVPATRRGLTETGLPYIIENVVGAPLIDPVQLCGSSFGLDVRRHRLFECSGFAPMVPPCAHGTQAPRFVQSDKRRGNVSRTIDVSGTGRKLASVVTVAGHLDYAGERALREKAMEVDWMTVYELSQAIPPAYTELLGAQLLAVAVSTP